MKKYFTYMVMFDESYLYTGSTGNLTKRVKQHQNKGRSFRILWKEVFVTRAAALERERQIKGWSRAKKLALAEGKKSVLRQRSKRRSGRTVDDPDQDLLPKALPNPASSGSLA